MTSIKHKRVQPKLHRMELSPRESRCVLPSLVRVGNRAELKRTAPEQTVELKDAQL
jgi:hypothetical protein